MHRPFATLRVTFISYVAKFWGSTPAAGAAGILPRAAGEDPCRTTLLDLTNAIYLTPLGQASKA